MDKGTKTVIGVVLFVAVVLVAVGYAAITSITLNINGTLEAEASDANFSVKFVQEEPETSGDGVIEASVTDDTHAVLNVSGLTAKGQTATATYTIQNTSADLSAALSAAVTNSNEEYFEVTQQIAEPTTVTAGGTTTITVTVELLKTPVNEEPAELKSTIGVAITANPVQP